jgi:hypothetical protein
MIEELGYDMVCYILHELYTKDYTERIGWLINRIVACEMSMSCMITTKSKENVMMNKRKTERKKNRKKLDVH